MENPTHNDRRVARSEAAKFRARRDLARARQDILEGLEPAPRPSIYGPLNVTVVNGSWEVCRGCN